MATGLAAAVVLGALVGGLMVTQRFFRAPRLILTVVTIGLAAGLSAGEIFMPRGFGVKVPPQQFASPFNFSFRIHPLVFHGNDLLAMVMVPVSIVLLAGFFRYTNIGIAVRASAESADRASLLGVPVRRVNVVLWIVATLLATVGLILRAGVVGLPIGSALGLPILVRALAASVIGRMERLPTIFVASLGIGIIEQAVVWHTGRGLLVDPILFVVIIGALLVQRRRASRQDDAAISSWQAVREVRPTPRELASLPEVRWGLRGIYALLGLVVLVLPPLLGEARTNLAGALMIYAIIAISLVVLTGWAGQVSLGQFAFVGIGAAVGAWLTLNWHWDLLLVLVAAGIVGAVVAVLIGIPALRIKGLFLAVATLSFALATASYLLNGDFVHWIPRSSARIPRSPILGRIAIDSETRYYYLCLACLLVVMLAVRGLRRSRTGRVLIGVRENERAAQAFGVNATRAKLTAFAVSGFLAALAGALLVHQQQNLLINSYQPIQSLAVFVMVVIGGLGSIPGAILGAVYLQSFTWFNSAFPASLRPAAAFFGSSVGLILVLWFLPGGLGSVIYDTRDRLLRKIAARRGLVVPSLVADTRVDLAEPAVPEIDEALVPELATT
jgi:branched-chain amino acid transport system permease protein